MTLSSRHVQAKQNKIIIILETRPHGSHVPPAGKCFASFFGVWQRVALALTSYFRGRQTLIHWPIFLPATPWLLASAVSGRVDGFLHDTNVHHDAQSRQIAAKRKCRGKKEEKEKTVSIFKSWPYDIVTFTTGITHVQFSHFQPCIRRQ